MTECCWLLAYSKAWEVSHHCWPRDNNGYAGKEDEERVDLLRESASKFQYYASGRRFAEGMLVTLDLRARQDIIMGYLLNLLLPQDDLIDFEVCPICFILMYFLCSQPVWTSDWNLYSRFSRTERSLRQLVKCA